MKRVHISTILLLSILIMSGQSFSKNELPVLKGPYLGQKPPGSTAEPFAPGIATTQGLEDGGVFSPDMDEFYFIKERSDNSKMESIVYKQKNNRWFETVDDPYSDIDINWADAQIIETLKPKR